MDPDAPIGEFVDCSGIEDLAQRLFEKPPGEPLSKQIQLDPESVPVEKAVDRVLFEIYRDLTGMGFAILFGRDRAVSSLTAVERARLNAYLESVGARIHFVQPSEPNAQPVQTPQTLPWLLKIPDVQPSTPDTPWHTLYFELLKPVVG